MSNVIALIPARSGSKGIPGKNFRALGRKTLVEHAYDCAHAAGVRAIVSTDCETQPWSKPLDVIDEEGRQAGFGPWMPLRRPAHLAQDDTPMFDVVQHAVETLNLADEDIVVLLQPTAVFRKPDHVTKAVQMLKETGADSVVSVVPLPLTHSPDLVCYLDAEGRLASWYGKLEWQGVKTRRQDAMPVYKRDGTVYAFYVKTLKSGTLYGSDVRPFILAPSETCELDTELDWEAVQARWSAQHG